MNYRNRKECSEIQMKLKFLIRVFDYHKSLSYRQLDIVSDPKLIRYFAEKRRKRIKIGKWENAKKQGLIICVFQLKCGFPSCVKLLTYPLATTNHFCIQENSMITLTSIFNIFSLIKIQEKKKRVSQRNLDYDSGEPIFLHVPITHTCNRR
ncbi:hypothetical protein Hanom_Chr10g00884511 [Helianthus anomalus]